MFFVLASICITVYQTMKHIDVLITRWCVDCAVLMGYDTVPDSFGLTVTLFPHAPPTPPTLKVPTLMKATADDENPCPGYLFQEIGSILCSFCCFLLKPLKLTHIQYVAQMAHTKK